MPAKRKSKDPKVGTGKKPKGSDRRLYTDENPKDTVGIKFATPADARATVAKVKKINKPFARKIQILTVGEQRAKVMGKSEVVNIFKKGKEAIRKQNKQKKQLGGLDENNMPIGTDIGQSYLSTIPKPQSVNIPVSDISKLATRGSQLMQLESDLGAISGTRPLTIEEAPELYKTNFNTDTKNFWNALMKKYSEFRILGAKDRLGKLAVQMAEYSNSLELVEQLYGSNDITLDERNVLNKEITDGKLFKKSDKVGPGAQVLNRILGLRYDQVSPQDIQNFVNTTYSQGLLTAEDLQRTTIDESVTMESMLEKRRELQEEIEGRESKMDRRAKTLGEDYALRTKLSEARGETAGGDVFGQQDYFEYQLADDLAGMVSTWEGMATSIAGATIPAIVRNVSKTKDPRTALGLTAAEIATIAYGQYWSRSAETSMEVGEAYEQKVQQLMKDKQEEIKKSGSTRPLTQKETNDIYIQAADGLDELRDKNMTLGATDLVQFALTFGRIPGMKWAGNTAIGKVSQAARSNPYTRVGYNLGRYGLAIGLSRQLEGMEEGMQYRWMEDYMGNHNIGDAGFFPHAAEGVKDMANYFGMVTGIKEKDKMYNTPGMQNAIQAGKDMATVMTGAGRAHRGITDQYHYRVALNALGEDGKNYDALEASRIKREALLPYFINGRTKYLQDALYRMGSKGTIDGFDKDAAIDAIKEIDQLKNDYNKIFDKRSPIGISIAGFEYDILRGAQISPHTQYDRGFVFNNVSDIRSQEKLLEDLKGQRDTHLSNKSELADFFVDDALTDAQKQSIEQKLAQRGINATPVDLLIEELEADIASKKQDNANIGTGDYTFAATPGLAPGLYKREDFDALFIPDRKGKLAGGILKQIQDLQKKKLDSQTQVEGAPAFTEEDQQLLDNLILAKNKLEYEAAFEYFGKQRLKNKNRIARAAAYDTLTRLISILESRGKEGLKEVLPSILTNNTKMDQQTIEEIAQLADQIVTDNQKAVERSGQIEDEIDTLLGIDGEMTEAELADHDRLLKEKEQTGLSTNVQELERLRKRKEADRKSKELRKEQLALNESIKTGSQIAQQAQNLLNRLAKDNTDHLLDDSNYTPSTNESLVRDVAVEDISNELAKIAAELQDNPQYANLDRIDSALNDLERRIAIFGLRIEDTELQSEKDLYESVKQELEGLLPSASELRSIIEQNAISRGIAQLELEGDVVTQMLAPLGLDAEFNVVEEGLNKKLQDVVSQEQIDSVISGVQSGEITDKIMAAQILLDLFKIGLNEQPGFKNDLVQDIQGTLKSLKLGLENQFRGMQKAGGNAYIKDPANNFPSIYFNFLGREQKDPNNAYFKYQDHVSEPKLLRELKQQGIMPEMQKLLELHLSVKTLENFLKELESDVTAATNILNEKQLVDNKRLTYLPTKQQINAVREIVSFLYTPLAKLSKGKKGLGSVSALLQGAAGTGKTNIVLKMAIQMAGLANNQIFAFGHNDSSSETINKSLGLPTNTIEKFLSDDTVIYDAVRLLIIDEAPGISTEQQLQIQQKVEQINEGRAAGDKLRVILAGDPAQITQDGSNRPLATSQIEFNLAKVITPVTSLYRSDNPAIIDFQDSFRRRVDIPTNRIINVRSTGVNFKTADETQGMLSGVIGLGGNMKDEIVERLMKLEDAEAGPRAIITNPSRVEEYRAFLEANNIKKTEVLSYIDAQGRTLEEVYMDINAADFADEAGQIDGEAFNKALYTAASRASRLVIASGLNIVNAVDVNLDNLSSGLSQEISDRNDQYITEVNANAEFIKMFPQLVEDVDPGQVVVTPTETQSPEEAQKIVDELFPLEEEGDPLGIDDRVEFELDDADVDVNLAEQDVEYQENKFDTGGQSITYKGRKEKGKPKSDALYYPESEALLEDIDSGGQAIAPISEDMGVMFVKVDRDGQSGIAVIQQAYRTMSDGTADISRPIQDTYKRVAVIGLDELDTGLSFLSNQEKEVLKAALQSDDLGARFIQFGTKNASTVEDLDGDVAAYNLLAGFRIPKGGTQRFKFKYKSAKRVRGEVRVQNPNIWAQDNRGVIDRVKQKFLSGAYTDSQPPKNPNAISFDLKVFTREDINNAAVAMPEMSSELVKNLQPGRPYLVISNAEVKNGEPKTYAIELRPRPISPKIKSDFDKFYEPMLVFIRTMKELEQILQAPYGSKGLHQLIVPGKRSEEQMQELIAARLQEIGQPQLLPQALELRDEILMLRFERRNEKGELTGIGPAQKAINRLGVSNSMLRTVRMTKDGKRAVPRSLLTYLNEQEELDSMSNRNKFTIERLEDLFDPNVNWNNGGVGQTGLYLPIANFAVYKNIDQYMEQIEQSLIDILEEVEPSKIILERPGKPKPQKAPTRQVEKKEDTIIISDEEQKEADNIIGGIELDYRDNNSGLKGEKITRQKALNLLKKLLPDMFDKSGKIIPSMLSMLNFAEMERMTGRTDVLGRFSKGVIFLLEDKTGVYENVVRHEALHKVIWNYLTPAERTALYKAARQRYKMPEGIFSNKEVEEKLADEFMTYRQKPESFKDAIGRFFKKLLKLFGFYQKNVNNIDAFFANVESGYFSGKMYTPTDVTGLNYIDIEKTFGTVQVYRDSSKIFKSLMANNMDTNNKKAAIDKESKKVLRPPVSRDEALRMTAQQVLNNLAKMEQIANPTVDQKRLIAATRKLSQEKVLRTLFKEYYERDYKSLGVDLEIEEDVDAVNLKEIIERAFEKDHSLSLSEEVVDFLSGLTYQQKGTDTINRINIKHGYFILLQLFAGLDSSLGFNGMQEELLKRGNKLGFKPGTAGQAVLNKLTDPKQGILVQGLVDRLPGRKTIPGNARFISDSLFIFAEDKGRDIYNINSDIDLNPEGIKRVVRKKDELSEDFFYRVWEAMQENGQELNSNQLKALYVKETSLKTLKNIFVNAANLRKENFKIGEYGFEGERKTVSYYTHRSFGTDAVQRSSVKDGMTTNAKRLVGNIPGIVQKLKAGKVEDGVIQFLDVIGYDRSLISLDFRNEAELKQKLINMLEEVKNNYNKDVNVLSETEFDSNNKPVVTGKRKITMEEIVDNERSTINLLGGALQFIGQGQKPQSIRNADGKNIYIYHNSSFGVDAILSLRPSVKKKDRKEYLQEGSPAYESTYQYNIFANGDSRIYNISDHDAIISSSGFGRAKVYRREEEANWSDRIFNYMFLADMSAIDKGKGIYKYSQQIHTVADAPTLKAAEVRFLMPDQQDAAIRNIIRQYKSKPKKGSPTAFTSILESNMSESQKLAAIKKEFKDRAKKFEQDLKDNNVNYNTNAMDGMIKVLQDNGVIAKFEGDEVQREEQKEKARSQVIEQFVANYAINGFFLNQIVLGDEAQFGNSFKVIKRTKIAFAPGYKGFVNDKYGMQKEFRVIVANDPVASPFDYMSDKEKAELRDDMKAIMGTEFENFDMADAQGFILPERLADIRRGFGGGIKISTVLKPVYFGVDKDGQTHALKYSAVVLSDDLVSKHPKLEQLRAAMRAIKADEYVFKTANKVGGPKTLAGNGYANNKVTVDGKFNEELNFTEDNVVVLDNKNYRIQLDPKAALDKVVSNPTQLAYFIDSNGLNFDAALEYYQLMADEFGMGLEDFLRSVDSLSSNKKNAIESPEKSRINNMRHRARQMAKESASKLASSQKEAEVLSTKAKVVEQDKDGNNIERERFAIDINFPGVAQKVFSLMLSKLKSHTVKVKFPGYKMVLQSSYGIDVYEENGVARTKDQIENFDEKLANGTIKERPLKHITADKPYVEVLMPSIHQDRFQIGDTILNENMMGFRIPSTELHSAVAIKVVGFYDAFQTNVLVAPKELTPLHGSDFDVDSLFVIRKATMFDNKNGKKLYANTERGLEYDGELILSMADSLDVAFLDLVQERYDKASDRFSELMVMQRQELAKESPVKEALDAIKDEMSAINKFRDMARVAMSAMRKNRMLDIYLEVIEAKKNRASMLTPIDMNNFKGVNRKGSPSVFDALSQALGVEIQDGHEQLYRDIDLTDPLGERYMHQSNRQGAILTGVFANAMKVLIYARKGKEVQGNKEESKVFYGSGDNILSYEIDGTNYAELAINARGKDINGEIADEYVYGTLDSAVNASIDNANEQILNIINLNGDTSAIFTVMTSQGVPLNKVAFFINQPIIRAASKSLGFRMTNKLTKMEEIVANKLGLNMDQLQERLNSVEITTEALRDGVRRSDILEDKSLDDMLGSSAKEILFQLKVAQLAKQILKYDDTLRDMSKALSVLQSMPSSLAEFEDIKQAVAKIVTRNEDGELEFNSNFGMQIPDITKNLAHFRAAMEVVEAFDVYSENAFHIAHPEMKAFAAEIGKQFTTDKEEKETANEKNVKIRTEFIKYIASGMPQFTTINEPLYTYKGTFGEIQFGGTRAFISGLVDDIAALPKSERFNNKFLAGLEIRRQAGRPSGVKFQGASSLTQEDLIELYNDFEKIDGALKNKLVKYAVVAEGMSFGAGNISLVINPKYFAEVEKERTKLMDKIFPAKSAGKAAIAKAQTMRDNILEHFEIQFALNNIGNVKRIYGKETGEVLTENGKTISRKVKDGRAYYFKMENGPKYLKNNFTGDLYIRTYQETKDDLIVAYYDKVGKSNNAASIYSSSEFVMDNGYLINQAFNSQYPVFAVNNLDSNTVDIIGKYEGLEPGMMVGLVLRGDEVRSNMQLAEIDSIDTSKENIISLSLKPGRSVVTGKAATTEAYKRVHNVKPSQEC